jgi:putative ABC transport system permease protein
MSIFSAFSGLGGDLHYALRALWKKPGFTVMAIAVMGVGLGANTTVFSMVNGILIRPLPFPASERLVHLDESAPKIGMKHLAVSYPNFADWKTQSRSFEGMAAHSRASLTLTGHGEPRSVTAIRSSADLFEVLGVSPSLGRVFLPEEDRPGGPKVAVLGHALWQQQFGADPDMVGKQIRLQGISHTVVGVMPPGFLFPHQGELWVPLARDPAEGRDNHDMVVVARLKKGVSLDQARAEMMAIARRIGQEHKRSSDSEVLVMPLRDAFFYDSKLVLWLLLGAVLFLLLIACANVANLFLVRSASRQKEMAIRAALGASRWRVLRQLLLESLVLSTMGGALGILLGIWGRDLLLAAVPVALPLGIIIELDWRVIIFMAALCVGTAILFSLAPAGQATRANLRDNLQAAGKGTVGGRAQRLRGTFVVAQVAVALVLLIGSGLMMKGFLLLQQTDPGFNPGQVMTCRVSLPSSRYSEDGPRQQTIQLLLERVKSHPGVVNAAAISNLPLGGSNWGMSYSVEGFPSQEEGQLPVANHRVVTPGYFETMGISLLRGRLFTEQDGGSGNLPVAIINQTMARRWWGQEDPIGKRWKYGQGSGPDPWITVVGVVSDVKHYGLDKEVREGVYVPHLQYPVGDLVLTVRTSSHSIPLIAAIKEEVWRIDPDLPVFQALSMDEVMANSSFMPRFAAWLFLVFSAVALALAALGVYGVMSYAVSQRTQEIGLRMALGARKGDVLELILRHGMKLVTLGLLVGLSGAAVLCRILSSAFYGVSPSDPLTFASVTLLLVLVALLACLIPAHRASRVEPVIALREE